MANEKKVTARALADGAGFSINDVLEGPVAEAAIAAGLADADPAAVAQARKEARAAARKAGE